MSMIIALQISEGPEGFKNGMDHRGYQPGGSTKNRNRIPTPCVYPEHPAA